MCHNPESRKPFAVSAISGKAFVNSNFKQCFPRFQKYPDWFIFCEKKSVEQFFGRGWSMSE
jgi:hypothetical protein